MNEFMKLRQKRRLKNENFHAKWRKTERDESRSQYQNMNIGQRDGGEKMANPSTKNDVSVQSQNQMPYSVHNLDSFVDFLYLFVCCIDGTNPKYNSWSLFRVTLSNLLDVHKKKDKDIHKKKTPKSMCMYKNNDKWAFIFLPTTTAHKKASDKTAYELFCTPCKRKKKKHKKKEERK